MKWSLVLAVAVVILACFTNAKKADNKKPDKRPKAKLTKDRVLVIEDTRIKIQGKSGKFWVTMKGQNESMSILMDAILEKDKDGKIVGKKGKEKHSLNTFAPIDFDFTATETTTFKGINASYFTFSALIPGTGATITVNMYFFTANGSSNVCGNDSNFMVKPGDVKFDVTISNWMFCGESGATCGGGEQGENVEFKLTVQKKGQGKLGEKKKDKGKKRKPKKIFFNGQAIDFPSVFEKDDTCSEMDEGYPNITRRGDKYTVTFKFPKFTGKVFYDPTVGDASDEAQYDTTTKISETPTDGGDAATTVAPTTDMPKTDMPTTAAPTTDAGSIIFPSFFSMILAGFVAIRF